MAPRQHERSFEEGVPFPDVDSWMGSCTQNSPEKGLGVSRNSVFRKGWFFGNRKNDNCYRCSGDYGLLIEFRITVITCDRLRPSAARAPMVSVMALWV